QGDPRRGLRASARGGEPPRGSGTARRLPDVQGACAGRVHPLSDLPHAPQARLPELREADSPGVEHLPVLREGLRRARLDRPPGRQGRSGARPVVTRAARDEVRVTRLALVLIAAIVSGATCQANLSTSPLSVITD